GTEPDRARNFKVPREEEYRLSHEIALAIDSARVVLTTKVIRIVIRHAARISLVVVITQESREGVVHVDLHPLAAPLRPERQSAVQRLANRGSRLDRAEVDGLPRSWTRAGESTAARETIRSYR